MNDHIEMMRLAELSRQLELVDAEMTKQADATANFYQFNYAPSEQLPLGWACAELQEHYYSMVRRTQALARKRAVILSQLVIIKASPSKSDILAAASRAKAKRRELEVTSSTYERAQKRLFKDVDNWRYGGAWGEGR